jgi:hypothetical protein
VWHDLIDINDLIKIKNTEQYKHILQSDTYTGEFKIINNGNTKVIQHKYNNKEYYYKQFYEDPVYDRYYFRQSTKVDNPNAIKRTEFTHTHTFSDDNKILLTNDVHDPDSLLYIQDNEIITCTTVDEKTNTYFMYEYFDLLDVFCRTDMLHFNTPCCTFKSISGQSNNRMDVKLVIYNPTNDTYLVDISDEIFAFPDGYFNSICENYEGLIQNDGVLRITDDEPRVDETNNIIYAHFLNLFYMLVTNVNDTTDVNDIIDVQEPCDMCDVDDNSDKSDEPRSDEWNIFLLLILPATHNIRLNNIVRFVDADTLLKFCAEADRQCEEHDMPTPIKIIHVNEVLKKIYDEN